MIMIKGIEKLNNKQVELMLRVNKLHTKAVGKDYKEGMKITRVWINENNTICVMLKNGEWYHYLKDNTWFQIGVFNVDREKLKKEIEKEEFDKIDKARNLMLSLRINKQERDLLDHIREETGHNITTIIIKAIKHYEENFLYR